MQGNSVILEVNRLRDFDFEACYGIGEVELPDTYVIPEGHIPPVHDQEWTSMCAAYSACQCAESRKLQTSGEKIHYSPAWNYCREECRGTYKGAGLFVSQLLKGLIQLGFLKEEYFDIMLDVPEILEYGKNRDDLVQLSQQFRPTGYVSLNYAYQDKKWQSVKEALYRSQRPLLASSAELFGGGHAVIIIGYKHVHNNRKGKWVLIQNSWGKSYGTDGRKWLNLDGFNGLYMLTWDDIKLPFNDINENDWFYKEVRNSYLSGLINGINANEFKPYNNMKRGDIACIIARMLEKLEFNINAFVNTKLSLGENVKNISFAEGSVVKDNFEDVKPNLYYAESIKIAVANGILKGDGNGLFRPEDTISRAEIAAVVNRLFSLVYEKFLEAVPGVYNLDTVEYQGFNDVKKEAWYYNDIKRACELQLLKGDLEGGFRPDDTLSRAEAATVLYRLFKLIDSLLAQG